MADRTTVKPQQYLLNHDRQILSGKPRFGRRNGPGARMLRVHLRRACKSQFQFPDIGMRTSDRVKIWPGLIDRLAALVHPKVQGDAMERARHILFVSLRLGLVLAAFVSVAWAAARSPTRSCASPSLITAVVLPAATALP